MFSNWLWSIVLPTTIYHDDEEERDTQVVFTSWLGVKWTPKPFVHGTLEALSYGQDQEIVLIGVYLLSHGLDQLLL